MSEGNSTSRTSGSSILIWIAAIILLLAVGLVIGFLAVDYAAGVALLVGIAGALALRWLINRRQQGRKEAQQAQQSAARARQGYYDDKLAEAEKAEAAPGGPLPAAPPPAMVAPAPVAAAPKAAAKGGSLLARLLIGLVVVGACVGVAALLITLGGAPAGGAFPIIEVEGEDTSAASVCPQAIVTAVQVVVEPVDLRDGTVRAGGTLTAYAPGGDGPWDECGRASDSAPFVLELEPETHTARKIGSLLWEISFASYQQVADALKAAGMADYSSEYTEVSVELRDFPNNTFFDARAATDLETSRYLRNETVTWMQRAIYPVTFSYVPPGWRFARGLLNLSYNAGSVGEGVVVVGSALGTFAISSVIQSVIGDYGKEQIARLAGKVRRKRR